VTDDGWVLQMRKMISNPGQFFLWLQEAYERQRWAAPLGALLLVGLLIAEKAPLLAQQAAPSGADPGNWLSLAWATTGQSARLADWSYPPLTFILLRALLFVLDPLVALKLVGLAAWAAMTVAFWLVLLRFTPLLPSLLKLGLTILFAFAGYNNEIFAWGGYPQMFVMAFLIGAILSWELYLSTGSRRSGVAAVLLTLGVLYTHLLMAAAAAACWLIVFAWTLLKCWPVRPAIIRRFVTLSLVLAALCLPLVPIYMKYLALLSGNPANTSGYSLQNLPILVRYLFRDLTPLWLVWLALGLAAPLALRRAQLSATAFAFTWGMLFAFLFLWEVRLLQILIAGIGFGLAILFERAWVHPSTAWFTRLRQGSLIACLGLVLLATLSQGRQEYLQASTYYRVVDPAVLDGLNWLRDHTHPGDRVAASRTRPDLIGWWVEGLARRPTLYAADLRWLSFRGEQDNTRIANQIFDPNTPPERIGEMIYTNKVRWVLLDKTAGQTNLSPLISQGVLFSAFENNRVLILQVAQNQAAGTAGIFFQPPAS